MAYSISMATRNILILSPEEWDFIQISKHHYARAAADSGCQVYFLDPPVHGLETITLAPTEHPAITRIRYPMVRLHERLRFHARPLYDWIECSTIARLRKALPALDLVWSFDRNRFRRLAKFGAGKVVYHPVDSVTEAHQLLPADDADVVFCVSRTILAPFLTRATPAHFLPHGISPAFANLAARSKPWVLPSGAIKVGFAGNLTRQIVARAVILALIEQHPDVEFHFWGSSEVRQSTDARIIEFVERLETSPNCRLRGVQVGGEFASQLEEMDIFLLAYQTAPNDAGFDFSNSHKVLEYLATGRVILSSPLSEYGNCRPDFIIFAEGNTLESFQAQFARIRSNLECLNRPALEEARKAYALENCYSSHWSKICQIIGL
ncbi:MAG: hypothetical protein ACKO2G_14995 [Verrucomicrobiales bacterium]